jgi:eukaryotic-like serine/threonine-protein kinase
MGTLTPGQELLGRYRLGHKIGSGGMGSIFVAQDLALNRAVAVKFMSAIYVDQTDLRARFEREARTAAGLRSAHIVEVFDVGSIDGIPFMVMELLEGEDLGARMRAPVAMSVDAVVSVVVQAARGLEVAHRAGVVHRDIKPANLFLARQGDSEIVKVLDFGIAKAPKPPGESTLTEETLGSPHYMSPEQAKGFARVDARADVWSLGVVAYRLLAGIPPFDGPGAGAIFVALCTEPHPAISGIRPDLPKELDAFFERALAKDPAARFPSALALAAELARTLGCSGASLAFDGLPSTGSAPSMPSARAAYTTNAPRPAPAASVRPPDVDGTLTEVVSPIFAKPRRRRVHWWVAGAVLFGAGVGGLAAARQRAASATAAAAGQAELDASVVEPTPAAGSGTPTSAPGSAPTIEVSVAPAVAPTGAPSAAATTAETPSKPRASVRPPPAPPARTTTSAPPAPTAAPSPSAASSRIRLGL